MLSDNYIAILTLPPVHRGVALIGMLPGQDLKDKVESLIEYLGLNLDNLIHEAWVKKVAETYLDDESLNERIRARKENQIENPKP